jgi:hypothetical protein
MCLECETVWPPPNDVEYGKGQNFEDFMAGQGRYAEWGAIDQIRKLVGKPA